MAKRKFDDNNLAEPSLISENEKLGLGIEFSPTLFGQSSPFSVGGESDITEIDVDKLVPLKDNPMNMDDDENFKALVQSIQEHGFLKEHPVVAEKNTDGTATLLSGNRRTKASKLAGIKKIPVIFKTFSSDEERRRFIDVCNSHRDPKLKDILNRYEYNEALYEKGYWKDQPIGQKGKLECIALVIGYSPFKINNMLFLLDIKHSHEKILDLIDEEVIVVNDMRKFVTLNKNGKVKNYEEVLDNICNDKTVNDKNEEKKIRKAAVKKIIAAAELKGKKKTLEEREMKKAHTEIRSIEKKISKVFNDGLTKPGTEKQIAETIEAIDKIMEKLGNFKKELLD